LDSMDKSRKGTFALKHLYSDEFWHLLMTRNSTSTVELLTSKRFSIHQELSKGKVLPFQAQKWSKQQRVFSLLSASTSPTTPPRAATPQLSGFSPTTILKHLKQKIVHQLSYLSISPKTTLSPSINIETWKHTSVEDQLCQQSNTEL
jgi:hypothetical protein